MWITEHLKFVRHRYSRKKQYQGGSGSICKRVVKDCWNGKYFQASTGHFTDFFMRDFGYCVEGLLKMGYHAEVHATLAYALEIFNAKKHIGVLITPTGDVVDFPAFPTDSLPLLLRSLRLADANDLLERYKELLEHQTMVYFNTVFDMKTGLVKQDTLFSSMKDHAIRNSSCYDNCMVSLLRDELKKLGLSNPFKEYDVKQNIITWFWNGEYFREEIASERITGDAQVMPFWCGVVNSKAMFRLCVSAIQSEELDSPFPLKYTKTREFKHITIPWIFVPNYEGNSIWMFIGMVYLEVVSRYDKKLLQRYLKDIGGVIEKNRRFVEVFNPDGTPYSTPFYMADTMLWACMYLRLMGR